jgi:hypothetical protein
MADAAVGVISVALNSFLRGFSWSSLMLRLLLAALFFLIGVKLLQLRYWALIAGRILALSGAVGFIALVATGRLAPASTVDSLEQLAAIVIAAAITVTIFLPSVSKAIPPPNNAEPA